MCLPELMGNDVLHVPRTRHNLLMCSAELTSASLLP
jgi:hypothetical protein